MASRIKNEITEQQLEALKIELLKHPMTGTEIARFLGYHITSKACGVDTCLVRLENMGFYLVEDDRTHQLGYMRPAIYEEYEQQLRNKVIMQELREEKRRCLMM